MGAGVRRTACTAASPPWSKSCTARSSFGTAGAFWSTVRDCRQPSLKPISTGRQQQQKLVPVLIQLQPAIMQFLSPLLLLLQLLLLPQRTQGWPQQQLSLMLLAVVPLWQLLWEMPHNQVPLLQVLPTPLADPLPAPLSATLSDPLPAPLLPPLAAPLPAPMSGPPSTPLPGPLPDPLPNPLPGPLPPTLT